MTRPDCRYVKPGEMLAIDPSVLRRSDVGAFFWMFSDPPKPNERVGDTTVVYIRGELEHHATAWGGESYEGLITKLKAAASGEDCRASYDRELQRRRWSEENFDETTVEPFEATPPKTIIACIDSPGGVVAGLNECVRSIQKIIKANPAIEFCAYIKEMAASAAYAIACGFGEILCPPDSAVLGSIGVISTMISQARKNEADGFDVVLLTSGARKSDGHVHAPITDKAKEVEMGRVNTLAQAFFSLASKARGIPVAKIEALQAGIFLSKDAKRRGLADGIMSWDDVLLGASAKEKDDSAHLSGGNETDRRVGVRSVAQPGTREANMSVQLSALIKKTEAKIATEKDPEKLATLYASLSAYKKTEKHIEHHKTEEDDNEDPDDKDDGDEDDDEESKSKKSEEEEKASAAKKEEEEKASKSKKGDEEDDEEEEAKAALALVRSLTGMKGKKALGALRSIASLAESTAQDVAALKKIQETSAKATFITSAKAQGRVTAKEAKWLSTQSMTTVEGFVEMRPKGSIVTTDEGDLVRPEHKQPGTEQSLPKETRDMIDQAVEAWAGDKEKYRAALVRSHLEAHAKAAMNGGVH